MIFNKLKYPFIILFALAIASAFFLPQNKLADAWGFFGHKRINRLAVFTLPGNLFGFYKNNIEFVTEHAVDPDKRRYASKFEAVRHYIDIDHWGTYPYENVPREYAAAILQQASFFIINERKDTIEVLGPEASGWGTDTITYSSRKLRKEFKYSYKQLLNFFKLDIFFPQQYEDIWRIKKSQFEQTLNVTIPGNDLEIEIIDQFTEYGTLPYNLMQMKFRLTKAFEEKDANKILRLSSDIGHYIGDAHVPLHTTENYNGQLTNQIGIHGFWESRIPELLADQNWDFLVGAAEYIIDPQEYFWDIVLASSQLVDSVLTIEKRLSNTFPVDLQYCYTDRNGRNIRTQCAEYTRAFDEAMKGMVEARMQGSIKAVGSIWYTCWVDAGKPKLSELMEDISFAIPKDSIPDERSRDSRIRSHDY